MDIKAFIYHKRAEKYCDCQDCFEIDTENKRIAISDGMSQSIFPQWWAEILVKAFLQTGEIPHKNISQYQQVWQNKVREEITKQERDGQKPWLLRNMFDDGEGAGATICGFEWSDNGWTCQCLGDSCLIKVKDDYSIEIITSQKGNFNNQPDYLDSFSDGRGTPITVEGDFNLKAILLVTDPFAELFQIHQSEKEFVKDCFCELCEIDSQELFVQLVEKWRDEFNMHNDDSTFVLLTNFDSLQIDVIKRSDLKNLCKEELEQIRIDENGSNNEKNVFVKQEVAVSQYKNSVENLLNYYPKGRNRRKRKVLDWLNDFCGSIVEKFSK